MPLIATSKLPVWTGWTPRLAGAVMAICGALVVIALWVAGERFALLMAKIEAMPRPAAVARPAISDPPGVVSVQIFRESTRAAAAGRRP